MFAFLFLSVNKISSRLFAALIEIDFSFGKIVKIFTESEVTVLTTNVVAEKNHQILYGKVKIKKIDCKNFNLKLYQSFI